MFVRTSDWCCVKAVHFQFSLGDARRNADAHEEPKGRKTSTKVFKKGEYNNGDYTLLSLFFIFFFFSFFLLSFSFSFFLVGFVC